MKNLIISFFILSLGSVLGQTSETENLSSKNLKITLGWTYSPEVSYRFLSEGKKANSNTLDEIETRNEATLPKFGQSFNLFWGSVLSNRFSLEGGLSYTDFGERGEPQDLYETHEQYEIVSATIFRKYQFHVISFPISLHVNFGKKKIQGFISGGIAPSYLLRYTHRTRNEYVTGVITSSNNYNSVSQGNYSSFIFATHISGGIDYRYSEKASLRIAPVFRMTTNSILSDKEIRGHYFNAGIEIGTVYKL